MMECAIDLFCDGTIYDLGSYKYKPWVKIVFCCPSSFDISIVSMVLSLISDFWV